MAAAELPLDVLALIFEAAGLDTVDGVEDRCRCRQVCRLWRDTLNQPHFWRSGSVPVSRFATLTDLSRFLHKFRDAHPVLRELRWRGHLRSQEAYRKEEHLLQPLFLATWSQLRVLRLEDCSVTAVCLAAVGASCPEMRELRFRGASSTYDSDRRSTRSELLRHSDMLCIIQGCRKLDVLDVAASGCSPFASRFTPDLLAAAARKLPRLQELTLFGEMRDVWGRLHLLDEAPSLRKLTCFGLTKLNNSLPYVIQPLDNSGITSLVLEEYELDGKLPVTLANALPRLESIDVSVLRSSQLLRRVLAVGAAPLSSLQRKIVQLQEDMEASRMAELEALASYFSQPFGKPIAMRLTEVDMRRAVERVARKRNWEWGGLVGAVPSAEGSPAGLALHAIVGIAVSLEESEELAAAVAAGAAGQ